MIPFMMNTFEHPQLLTCRLGSLLIADKPPCSMTFFESRITGCTGVPAPLVVTAVATGALLWSVWFCKLEWVTIRSDWSGNVLCCVEEPWTISTSLDWDSLRLADVVCKPGLFSDAVRIYWLTRFSILATIQSRLGLHEQEMFLGLKKGESC